MDLKYKLMLTLCGLFYHPLNSATFGNYTDENDISECLQISSCCFLSGNNPTPAKVIDLTCYSGQGHDYRGYVNTSERGRSCMNWMHTTAATLPQEKKERYGIGDHNFCRNYEPDESRGPWCYISKTYYGYCSVLPCSSYPSVNYGKVATPARCNTSTQKLEQPDVIFSFGSSVYYLTSLELQTNSKDYVMYKFNDETMTSFGTPPIQRIESTWNLCVRDHDILTFVTTNGADDSLFAYFQFPNVMLQVTHLPMGWRKVPTEIYGGCIDPIRNASQSFGLEMMIRNVHNVNSPSSVFLEVNQMQYECLWKDGQLVLSSSRNAQFPACDIKAAFFIDSQDKQFSFSRTTFSPGSLDDKLPAKLNSLEETLRQKPALAGPLLDYEVLRIDTLIKLRRISESNETHIDRVCYEDGHVPRPIHVHNGLQLLAIIDWLQQASVYVDNFVHKKSAVWMYFNKFYTRRADFCPDQGFDCCRNITNDFMIARNSASFANRQTTTWVKCAVDFTSSDSSHGQGRALCPKLSCFDTKKVSPRDFVLCGIHLDRASNQSASLENILGIEDGRSIKYENAIDASAKLGEIAAAVRDAGSSTNLDLRVLVGSVEALQPVDYSKLSQQDTKQLITDFVTVVDSLADEQRAGDWIKIRSENNSENNTSEAPSGNSRVNPHSLLFVTENFLQQVVAGGGSGVWSKSSASLTVTTTNFINVIETRYLNSSQSETNVNVSRTLGQYELVVNSSEANENFPAIIITSSFPHFSSLTSKIDKERHITDELHRKQEDKITKVIPNSPVLSATVIQNGVKISSAVEFKIPYVRSDVPSPHESGKKYYFACSFLEDDHQWNTRGCSVVDIDFGTNHVKCSCNHTTNFAILLQVIPPQISAADIKFLTMLSYVGESLSVICLIITLIIFTTFRRSLKSERMVAHFNLVIALLLFHIVQLFSSNAEKVKKVTVVPCILVAALTHFSLLATFIWMLCEGVTLHLSVVDVFHGLNKFKAWRYLLGWGVPFMISTISLAYGVTQPPFPVCYVEGVGEQSCRNQRMDSSDAQPNMQVIEWCWLSTENHLVWTMIFPAIIVLSFNAVVLARVFFVILRSTKAADQHVPTSERKHKNFDHINKAVKGALTLMPILGIPWLFGLIPQALTHVSLLYVFTLLNATQGIFILLFYCILNNEVRNVFLRFLRKRHLVHQQSWASQSHDRNEKIDLKRFAQTENDLDLRSTRVSPAVQRSISTTTNTTCLGGNSVGPESFLSSGGEGSTLLPQTAVVHQDRSQREQCSSEASREIVPTTTDNEEEATANLLTRDLPALLTD